MEKNIKDLNLAKELLLIQYHWLLASGGSHWHSICWAMLPGLLLIRCAMNSFPGSLSIWRKGRSNSAGNVPIPRLRRGHGCGHGPWYGQSWVRSPFCCFGCTPIVHWCLLVLCSFAKQCKKHQFLSNYGKNIRCSWLEASGNLRSLCLFA